MWVLYCLVLIWSWGFFGGFFYFVIVNFNRYHLQNAYCRLGIAILFGPIACLTAHDFDDCFQVVWADLKKFTKNVMEGEL